MPALEIEMDVGRGVLMEPHKSIPVLTFQPRNVAARNEFV